MFTIIVEHATYDGSGGNVVTIGKLRLVDLAGSEKYVNKINNGTAHAVAQFSILFFFVCFLLLFLFLLLFPPPPPPPPPLFCFLYEFVSCPCVFCVVIYVCVCV